VKKMKKNKKKILIIALLLFTIIGLTGYGVYSYYWTQGDFTSSDGQIRTNKVFDPEGLHEYNEDSDSYNMSFLGDGGEVKLVCADDDYDGYLTCTGYSPVGNDGNVSINVSYSNFNITCDDDSVDISSITPTFTWTYVDDDGHDHTSSSSSITLDEDEEATLVTTFEIESPGTSSTPEQVSAPVAGNTLELGMTIDLTATQVHN